MFRKTNSLFLATITILALATIYNIYGSSDTYAATASLSTTGSVNIDISASGNGANIGTDTLTVNTTCSAGYTIAIKSSTSDAALYKDGDSTSTSKINPSSGTLSSPASILGDNIGTWGYSMTDSTISGNFIGLNNTPTIIKNSNTASASGGDSIPVYFGVSIPNSLEPGQYKMANSGTIVYQLTMPIECDPYTIKYNGNNSDAGTTMSVTNKVDENTSTTLMPSNYKRAGYGFAGWNTKADGTGENFGPMEDIVLSTSDAKGNALLSVADANKEITLYAKWIASAGDIQDWDGCSAMNVGDVTALTDTRDDNTYAIAKLADGNCWMIENLRLSNTNSDNATGALAQGYGSNFIGLPDPETANFNEDGVANSLYSNDGSTSVTVANTRFPRYNNTNTTNPTANMTATYQNIYSYGNYYTWPAAAADINYNAANNYSAETSICPKGWHLPKGGNKDNESNNEFWGLIVDGINNGNKPANYDSALDPYYTGSPEGTGISKLIRQYPNNFIYSGYIQDSWFGGHGTTGDFWAATTDGFGNAYGVAFNLNYITPGTRFVAKYYGRTVRCVADAPAKIAYLDIGSDIGGKLKTLANGSYTSTDTLIKAFVRADTLPSDFTPSDTNTISLSTSPEPIYIWFDNVTGVMSYYSEAGDIYMHEYSNDIFANMKSLVDISGLRDWKADDVTQSTSMFYSTKISDYSPISDWNTGNVTNMDDMFYESNISDLTPLTNWDVSSVESMWMLFAMSKVSDLTPISSWNIKNLKSIGGLLHSTAVSDLTPLANWDVKNVTDFMQTFFNTPVSDLTPIANWNVGKATTMEMMFSYLKLTNLTPIANWDVKNVINMSEMFYGIETLTDATAISGWDVRKVTDFDHMFFNGKVSNINLPTFTLRPGSWNSSGTYIPNP